MLELVNVIVSSPITTLVNSINNSPNKKNILSVEVISYVLNLLIKTKINGTESESKWLFKMCMRIT